MSSIIASAIERNENLDILKTFSVLPTSLECSEAIQEILQLHSRSREHLIKHRSLVVVSRLIEEFATRFPCSPKSELVHIINQCADLKLTAGQDPDLLQRNVNLLPSALRTEAFHHLREAILDIGLESHVTRFASTRSNWSLKAAHVKISSPARLDLGMGGITDIPPYSLENYGNCINMPIALDGMFPLSVTVQMLNDPVIQLISQDLRIQKVFADFSEFEGKNNPLSIHQNVLMFFAHKILKLNSTDELFRVLKGGIRIETYSSLPMGSGLGASSLLLCAAIKALSILFDMTLNTQALFTIGVYLESAIGIGGGWEDISAIYSGLKLMESFPDKPFAPQITKLQTDNQTLKKLRNNILLVHTGITKQGPAFFDKMVEGYCLRESAIMNAIARNNEINLEISSLLPSGQIEAIGEKMREQWANWKLLSNNQCTNSTIDQLFADIEKMSYGERINGAGQGGCAMLTIREGKASELKQIVRSVLGDSVIFYNWEPVL